MNQILLKIATFFTVLFPVFLFFGNVPIDISVIAVGSLFVVNSVLTKDFSWLKVRWVQAAFLLWGAFLLSSALAESPREALARSLPFIRFPLFAIALGTWVLKDEKTKKWTLYSIVAGITLASINALFQYATGVDFFGHEFVDAKSFVRLTTPGGKIVVGMLIASALFPAATYCLEKVTKKEIKLYHKALALGFLLISFAAVVLSGERMALLMVLLGYFFLMLFNNALRKVMLVMAVAIAILIGGIIAYDKQVVFRQVEQSHKIISNLSNSLYGKIFTSGIKVFMADPIVGVGPKHFRKVCIDPKYGSTEKQDDGKVIRCATHPHNNYIEIFAESGLIGGVLFLYMVSLWFAFMWSERRAIVKDPLVLGATIAVLIRLFPIASTGSFFIAWAVAPLWFMVGVLYSKHHRR